MLNTRKLLFVAALIPVLWSGIPSAKAWDHRNDWHQGRWVHDRHGGRLGWWWVVGPTWTYYARPYVVQPPVVVQAAPVMVQQPPQVVVVQQPAVAQPVPPPAQPPVVQAVPQTPVLYYCKATGTHYPETMTCPGGWSTMTATTPPEP